MKLYVEWMYLLCFTNELTAFLLCTAVIPLLIDYFPFLNHIKHRFPCTKVMRPKKNRQHIHTHKQTHKHTKQNKTKTNLNKTKKTTQQHQQQQQQSSHRLGGCRFLIRKSSKISSKYEEFTCKVHSDKFLIHFPKICGKWAKIYESNFFFFLFEG